jgi:CubicO group peptidase (beta-lactamase class C family)
MSDHPNFKSLDECVEHWRTHWNVPGMGVAILNDGTVEEHGYGITSIDTKHPIRADTLFQIGSISKVYTTTLAMILVDQGKLDLDEPVTTYLPSLKLKDENALRTITLRHLVTHTSGVFGDFFDDFGMGDDALGRYVDAMAELRQIYQPSELWSYTNSGFNLAGYMMERVLDKPFEDIMRELLLEPAGFDRTFQFAHEAITYPLAVGHTHPDPEDEERLEIARRYPLPRTSHAAGGIISTVGDLIKFAKLHLDDGRANGTQIISPSAVEEMQTPQVKAANMADEWGLGWMIFDMAGTKGIGHGGTTNGFQAVTRIVPEREFAIAILTNSDRGHAAEAPILKWAFKHYLAIDMPEHQEVMLEQARLERFVGKYSQPLADVIISNQNGTLHMDVFQKSALADSDEVKKMPTVEIKPIGDRKFVITTGPMAGHTLDFVDTETGDTRFIRVGGRFADRVTE